MKSVISGSFSTGKSTLFNAVKHEVFDAHKANVFFIQETARELQKKLNLRIQSMTPLEKAKFQMKLLRYQIEKEQSTDSFISDTSIFDILAYSQDAPNYSELLHIALSYIQSQQYSHVFFIPVELSIEDDGYRIIDTSFQKEIQSRILSYYNEFNIAYTVACGSIEQRLTTVRNTLKL